MTTESAPQSHPCPLIPHVSYSLRRDAVLLREPALCTCMKDWSLEKSLQRDAMLAGERACVGGSCAEEAPKTRAGALVDFGQVNRYRIPGCDGASFVSRDTSAPQVPAPRRLPSWFPNRRACLACSTFRALA